MTGACVNWGGGMMHGGPTCHRSDQGPGGRPWRRAACVHDCAAGRRGLRDAGPVPSRVRRRHGPDIRLRARRSPALAGVRGAHHRDGARTGAVNGGSGSRPFWRHLRVTAPDPLRCQRVRGQLGDDVPEEHLLPVRPWRQPARLERLGHLPARPGIRPALPLGPDQDPP